MLRLGRYELFDVIGTGGMATVHLARAHGAGGFSRLVAVKRLNEQYARDPDFVAMFVDEARVASRIRHPNVVQIYDVVSLDGELFLVLEYVSGVALSRLVGPQASIGQGRALPPAIASRLFVGVLEGLHAAHEARDERGNALQIVHRDVSPQNVLVGEDGNAHLVDFGIAKAIGRSHVTRDGALKGKVPYMAPEQFRGEAVTRSVDVYAASVTLWEALTGRRLFEGDEQPELLVRVLTAPVTPPSRYAPDTPPALDAVVMRGLDRERTRRFPTAAAMARALEAAVPPASSLVVADWLNELAHDEISERTALAAKIEVTSTSVAPLPAEPNPAAQIASADSEPPPRRGGLIAIGAGIALAAATAAFYIRRGPPLAEPLSIAPSAAEVAPSPPPRPSSATDVDAVDAAADVPPGRAREARGRAPRLLSTPQKTAPAKATDDCDPPFTLEGERKVWKRHCLAR